MILLDSALCSKDFRKVGIIHSSANIFCQGICLFLLTIYRAFDARSDRSILIIVYFLILTDMVLYSLLIYGLAKRKPALLLLWLSFAPLELAIVAIFFLTGVYVSMASFGLADGFITLIAYIVFVSFMFHNICIVLSARHGFIHDREPQNLPNQPVNTIVNTTDNTTPFVLENNGRVLHISTFSPTAPTIMAMSSPPSYEQCNTVL